MVLVIDDGVEFKVMRFNNTEYYFAEVIEEKEAVGVTYMSRQVVTVMRVTESAISAEYVDPFTCRELSTMLQVTDESEGIYKDTNTGVVIRLVKRTNWLVAMLSALKHVFVKPKVEIL